MTTEMTGAKKIIWIGGVVVASTFILIMFVLLVLSLLDSDYKHIGSYLIFASYGILHLMVNGAFKANRKWGKPGLLTLYSLWTLAALYSALFGEGSGTDELALLTAVIVAIGSILLITLLLLSRPGAQNRNKQVA